MQLIFSTLMEPINILCGSIGQDKCFALGICRIQVIVASMVGE